MIPPSSESSPGGRATDDLVAFLRALALEFWDDLEDAKAEHCQDAADLVESFSARVASLQQERDALKAKVADWQAHDDQVRATLARVTEGDKARDVCGSIEQIAQERDELRRQLDGRQADRPCIDCGKAITDGEFDICQACEDEFHRIEEEGLHGSGGQPPSGQG